MFLFIIETWYCQFNELASVGANEAYRNNSEPLTRFLFLMSHPSWTLSLGSLAMDCMFSCFQMMS